MNPSGGPIGCQAGWSSAWVKPAHRRSPSRDRHDVNEGRRKGGVAALARAVVLPSVEWLKALRLPPSQPASRLCAWSRPTLTARSSSLTARSASGLLAPSAPPATRGST